MLWDKTSLEPVELISDQRGLAPALTACDDLSGLLRRALDRASFDVIVVDTAAKCLSAIPDDKPDIVFLDEHLVKSFADIQCKIATARVTETLPVLPIGRNSHDRETASALNAESPEIEIFLKTRALLRRERPVALSGTRRNGPFILDEPGFRLHISDKSVDLSKTELCLIGPFFDVDETVLDRKSLEHLAFAGNTWKSGSRSTEFHVIRMRRRVKDRIGIDPLRSVRGIGYALADV